MEIGNSFLNVFQYNAAPKINENGVNLLNLGSSSPLKPLDRDTVSFSGKKQEVKKELSASGDKKIKKAERTSLYLTQQMYDESKPAYDKFKNILRDTFPKADVIDIESPLAELRAFRAIHENQNEPVIMITTRRKTPASISEKMAQKHIAGKKEAKKEINDILGARIIVPENNPKSGDFVLDSLSRAVKKNKIKVTSVKNHGQENSGLNYASQKKINKFVNTVRNNGSPLCEYRDQPRDTGYIAMHILTDDIEDGYSAEIQIMGLNVERFKRIEDLFYKCLSDKEIPKKYDFIKDMLAPLKDDKELSDNFKEYTKRAYAYERQKPANENGMYSGYLPIPDDLDIPEELDFNNIEKERRRLGVRSDNG